MRAKLLWLVGLALLLMPAINAQTAQAAYTARIQGTVLDAASGAPIENAEISVAGGYRTFSAPDGTFAFEAVALTEAVGVVTVTVSAESYGTYTLQDTPILGNDTMLLTVELTAEAQFYDAGGLQSISQVSDPTALDEPQLYDEFTAQADSAVGGNEPFFWSHSVIPPTIRVAISGRTRCGERNSSGVFVYYPVQRVDTLDFKQYTKNVLPSEWINSWNGASLRAGAVAVKMYAWWKINIGPRTRDGFTFDVWGDTCDQMYIPGREFASTNAAIEDTWNYIMRFNGQVGRIHYTATDEVCQANNLSPCMSQWGSKALGDQGYDWGAILRHYYGSSVEILFVGGPPAANTNLVRNSNFSGGTTEWTTSGDMPTPSTVNGALSVSRGSGGGVVYQPLGYSAQFGWPFNIQLDLSNQSSGVKTVTVRLRATDSEAGAIACTFPLPASTGMQTYLMQGVAGATWSGLRFEVVLDTPDSTIWIDNVYAAYSPALGVTQTQCIRPAPLNDLFINRTALPAEGTTTSYALNGASVSQDDPALTCLGSPRDYADSVWFQYTPGASGTVQFNTAGSNFDGVLAVFTGNSPGSLTQIGCNDNFSSQTRTAYLSLNLSGGTTYTVLLARRGAAASSLTLMTLNVNRLGLLAPGGSVTANNGNPTYIWPNVSADYYYLYVAVYGGAQVINEVLASNTTLCSGALCQLDATTLRDQYRLNVGSYVVYMNTWKNGTPGAVVGPFVFTVQANPPGLVTMGAVTGTDTSRPTFNWTLNDAAATATRFWLYLAPSANLGAPVFHQEFSRAQACGSSSGTTCGVPSPVDLPNGVGYSAFVGACGVGGCATTGGPYNNGYAGPATFAVGVPQPNLPADFRVEVNQGRPTLIWDDDPKAVRYSVAISTEAWRWLYFQPHPRTEALCSGGECRLTPDLNVTNGRYHYYVNAEGVGGASTGGPYNNGYAAVEFVEINFAAPTAPGTFIAPVGNITSANPTFEWPTQPGATGYQLWVGTVTPSFQTRYLQWQVAGGAICTPHPGICRVRPTLNLPPGEYAWNLLAAGPGGSSSWGSGMAFTISGGAPGTLTLTAPTGTISVFNPEFTWVDQPSAERYHLWLGNPAVTETLHDQWYNRADVCTSGVCRVIVPALSLTNRAYLWNVRASNAGGTGAWTPNGQSFTVTVPLPAAPQMLAPADDAVIHATNRPTFSWTTVSNSQGYYLQVLDSTNVPVYERIHYATEAVCSAESCTVQVDQPITYGLYRWRVVPGNVNGAGTSTPWRDFMALSVNTQPMAAQMGDARLLREGNWTATTDAEAFGGDLLQNQSTDAGMPSVTLSFIGTQVDVVYLAAPGLGSFTVEIDGVALQTVDTNAPEIRYGQITTVRGLAQGTHTVRIIAQGQITLDAVVVDGEILTSIPVTPTAPPAVEATPEATPEPTPLPVEITPEATPQAAPTEPPAVETTPEATAESFEG
ncbi:MAG: carboxypeptidase regulatory-like domain-containing protein [bacterium]|nr:carboxypeptidase regulatory-like domain-containing protein [bacterium]